MKNIIYLILPFLLCSCTEQERAKAFGGSYTIDIPSGYRVIEATWKHKDLWYFIEPMDSDYVPKRKIFKEDSRYGVLEGEVIFYERK